MSNTASLKKEYAERIAPALMKQFQYTSPMQIPTLKKIVINQGLGEAVADKKIIEFYDLSAKTLESRKQLKNSFHKIKKIINILLALLIIVLILLISVQINKKSNINKQNLNIKKTTELFK